jgi:hypothetical protein
MMGIVETSLIEIGELIYETNVTNIKNIKNLKCGMYLISYILHVIQNYVINSRSV